MTTITDDMGIKGNGSIFVFEHGVLTDYARFDNLVTQFGDQAYGEGYPNIGSIPTPTGIQLGTGVSTPAKTGGGAAIGTYLSGSSSAIDGGWPTSTLVTGSRQIQYRATVAPGAGTSTAITEVVLINQNIATDSAAAAGNTISRATFSSITKSSIGVLVVVWNHLFLGAP